MASTRVTVSEALGSLVSPIDGAQGKYRIRIIEGDRWGSSGYYPATVIERDGPKVFAAGTHIFLDHPTATEEWDRPERSVRDLIGIIDSEPQYMPESKSLEADARFFKQYTPMIDEIKDHVGMSINAFAVQEYGDVQGQFGAIITEFVEAQSVDVVTRAGAGGAILKAIESAQSSGTKDLFTKGTKEIKPVQQRSAQQQRESAVGDTTLSTETLTALTTAMTSLTEALTKEQKDRADEKQAREAAEAAAKDADKPDPYDVATALAEAKLPKAYAKRAVEAVKAGATVEDAVKAAKDELADVLKEAGVQPAAGNGTAGVGSTTIGAPAGATVTGQTAAVPYGTVDISESRIEKILGQFAGTKGN